METLENFTITKSGKKPKNPGLAKIKTALRSNPDYIERKEIQNILGFSKHQINNFCMKFEGHYGFYKRSDVMHIIEDILERRKITPAKWVHAPSSTANGSR